MGSQFTTPKKERLLSRKKPTRSGIRSVIAGLAVVAALLVASIPVASAHQGHSGAPGNPVASHQNGKSGSGKKGTRKGGPRKPGHADNPGAPAR